MNLILMRSKQELWWEPFATSTPLKSALNKENNANVFPKQLLSETNAVGFVAKHAKGFNFNDLQSESFKTRHLASKQVRRNRSSAYFDVSSSSDDDNLSDNKRPVIKLGSKKRTKPLLDKQKLKGEEIESENQINLGEEIDDAKKMKNNSKSRGKKAISAHTKLKAENSKTLNSYSKNTSKIDCNSVLQNACLNSPEGNKTFYKTKRNSNLVTGTNSCLKNKENSINLAESDKVVEEQGYSILTEKSENKNMPKAILKSRHKNNKSPQTQAIADNKLSNTRKRKGRNTLHCASPIKKLTTKKVKTKSPNTALNIENTCTRTRLRKNRSNLSHQLFSDSREQEYTDSLDLTSDEFKDVTEKYCSWQKLKNIHSKQIPKSHPSSKSDDFKEEEDQQERPKRRTQKPKEFWILENASEKSLNNIGSEKESNIKRSTKVLVKSKDQNSQFKTVNKPKQHSILPEVNKPNKPNVEITRESENIFVKSLKTEKKIKRKKVCETQKQNLFTHNNQCSDIKLKNLKDNFEFSCSESDRAHNEEAASEEVFLKDAVMKRKTVNSDKPVFSMFNELLFKDNGMGCSAVQCWSTSNFKCGIFKIKVNSQLKHKTLHSNSHLGGVVLKGILKMKIGDKESELKEGDMAFVPPLTEWTAINLDECESVFYYWCGTFIN